MIPRSGFAKSKSEITENKYIAIHREMCGLHAVASRITIITNG